MPGVSPARGVCEAGPGRAAAASALAGMGNPGCWHRPGLLPSAALPLARAGISRSSRRASEHPVLLPAITKWQRRQTHFLRAVPERVSFPAPSPISGVNWQDPAVQPSFTEEQR